MVTGILTSGKNTAEKYISDELNISVISKYKIKERFDAVGFDCKKVKLGITAMNK